LIALAASEESSSRLQALEEERMDPAPSSGCAINVTVEVLGDLS
jgi:hypothetical protein